MNRYFNQRGLAIVAVIGLGFLFFIILPWILFYINGMSKVLFQVIMAFTILGYVKQMGLDGALMWIVSGILIYFIVWKYIYLFSSLYLIMMLMGFGFTSAIMWGSNALKGKIDVWSTNREAARLRKG
jgi:hypothetical protein